MKDNKIITILGVGGHGSSAYTQLTTDKKYRDYQIHLVLGTDDSGGHTGVLQRVLPKMNLNIEAHKVLPMGDLKSNIGRYVFNLSEDKEEGKQKLDQMVSAYKGTNLKEFLEKCFEFCKIYELNSNLYNKEFIEFCKNYFETFSETENSEPNHKIGNLFLTFLFINKGFNHEDFFSELRNLKLLPPQVFPHFLYSEVLELRGKNFDTGIEFISEAEVDDAKLPISPSSYKLVKLSDHSVLTLKDINSNHLEIINILQQSELVVLSTGSIANLFAQLNVLSPLLQILDCTKVWLGNFARSSNESEFVVLVTYYYSHEHLGLDGIVLQMNESSFDNLTINANDSTWVEKYRKQGKTFVNITDLMTSIKKVFNYNGLLKVTNLVQPVLGITAAGDSIAERIPGWDSLSTSKKETYKSVLEQGGIKHVSLEVTMFIEFFYYLHLFLKNELNVQIKDERYQKIAELLNLLQLDKKENLQHEINEYIKVLTTPNSKEEFVKAITEFNKDLKILAVQDLLK